MGHRRRGFLAVAGIALAAFVDSCRSTGTDHDRAIVAAAIELGGLAFVGLWAVSARAWLSTLGPWWSLSPQSRLSTRSISGRASHNGSDGLSACGCLKQCFLAPGHCPPVRLRAPWDGLAPDGYRRRDGSDSFAWFESRVAPDSYASKLSSSARLGPASGRRSPGSVAPAIACTTSSRPKTSLGSARLAIISASAR